MKNQQGAPEALRLAAEVLDWMPTSDTQRALWDRHQEALAVVKAALVDAQQPAAHVQNPAEIEHVAGDVSKNGPESNMAQQPAPSAAAAEIEGGPPGSGGWEKHAVEMERQRDYYRQRCHTMEEHQNGGVWYWQGDDGDSLESMGNSMLVVIRADQLRSLMQPSPTPQADSPPALVADGCTDPYNCKRCMTHPSHRDGMEHAGIPAHAVARAARAPADSVTAPAGGAVDGWKLAPEEPTLHMGWAYLDAARESDPLRTHTFNHAGYRAMLAAAPTPPALAADSVLEDAARLDWLQANSCDLRCIGVPTGGDDYDINWVVIEHYQAKPHEREIGRSWRDDPRGAIDAARKQGGAT